MDGDDTRVDQLLEELRRAPERVRFIQRALQPYVVNLWRHEAEGQLRAFIEEVVPGLDVRLWRGDYDARVRGIQPGVTFDTETLVV